MDKITYQAAEHTYSIIVKLGKKEAGRIIKDKDGYRYMPKNSRASGDTFASLAACKRSLES